MKITSPKYLVEDGSIVGRDQPHFANRSIYCANTNTAILAGDKPFLRLVKRRNLLGSFYVEIRTEAGSKKLHQCSDITMRYRPGVISYEVRDASFVGVVNMLVTAPENTQGMAIKLQSDFSGALRWVFGGVATLPDTVPGLNPECNINTNDEPSFKVTEFVEALCANNHIEVGDQGFSIRSQAVDADLSYPAVITGSCSVPGYAVSKAPYVYGDIKMAGDQALYWLFSLNDEKKPPQHRSALASGLERARRLAQTVQVATPDEFLNTLCATVSGELDGAWYPPYNVHSVSSWNIPYLGWYNRLGNTLLGWHDRALEEIRYYAPYQVKSDEKKSFESDPECRLTIAHPDSRFYGLGYINQHQHFYNMQTQFIDQAIHAWRATGDPQLQSVLYPMLELHTRWVDECFDPDNDGIYESYINTWPTDSVWYNGGGSAEETCYAFRAHTAAYEMSLLIGDQTVAQRHLDILNRIKTGFFKLLWIQQRGHAGKYREQGGYQRLHENPWLYSVFLPVDVGLLSDTQQVESLAYSRWVLENQSLPCGGRAVWVSNWVPSIWSVRQRTPGENFQLAYAYFLAGLPEHGYDILSGVLKEEGFNGPTPGNIVSEAASIFYRAVINGMFGYHPDYPHQKVMLSPEFPPAWESASLQATDVGINFEKNGEVVTFYFNLKQAAAVTVKLPFYCETVRDIKVRIGDQSASLQSTRQYKLLQGIGRQYVLLELPLCDQGEITYRDCGSPWYPQENQLTAQPASEISLQAPDKVLDVSDPQGIVQSVRKVGQTAYLKLKNISGEHLVFLVVSRGMGTILEPYYLHLSATAEETAHHERSHPQPTAMAQFIAVPVAGLFNADVTKIYSYEYLSPRPKTISARIGSDGYAPWTFTFWKCPLPVIDLSNIPSLTSLRKQIVASNEVPFEWAGTADKNIGFVSLWDNFPSEILFPINSTAKTLWFHLCGTTNPMQCGIANACLEISYTDGSVDRLDLVNPDNFWSLCSIDAHATAAEQASHNDYSYEFDSFCLPKTPPLTIQLGNHCRSVVCGFKTKENQEIKRVTLRALSSEIVIGILGITLEK